MQETGRWNYLSIYPALVNPAYHSCWHKKGGGGGEGRAIKTQRQREGMGRERGRWPILHKFHKQLKM